MAKIKSYYVCQSCGYQASQWVGKCPECEQWNSFVEETFASNNHSGSSKKILTSKKPKTIESIQRNVEERLMSGISEFDRVLGGGITKGSLNLLGGEPGVGKSTLLLEVCAKLLKNNVGPILYVSGEESEGQIADRFQRLGLESDKLLILHETSWDIIDQVIEQEAPQIFILDSIQTTALDSISSTAGSLSQIREVTHELMNKAKSQGVTCFIVGHVTKEGQIAGPKALEHMVDAVLSFEGDPFHHYRVLRAQKNRFGNTQEVGIFEMKGNGLHEVANPSLYFLSDSLPNAYGKALCCIQEGSRSLFVEVQALVLDNKFGNGRRTAQGIDQNRLSLLLAVIEKYLGVPLSMSDVYVNIVGGIKLKGRESDLAIIAAILSSHFSKMIDNDIIFLGEVGLTGEVRRVPGTEQKINEIERMNFKKIFLSVKEEVERPKLELIKIRTVLDLWNHSYFKDSH